MLQIMTDCNIQGLLGFHRKLHDSMVCLESINVVPVRLEYFLLDTLAEAVLSNDLDDFVSVLFLGIDPSNHLIKGERLGGQSRVQLIRLDHGLANGFAGLLDFGDNVRIVKDSAWNLTMSSAETKDQVKGGLLLNVVIRKGASIFKLLSGEDQTLLVRRNTFLVLDLGLDILNRVSGLNIESDGLSGKSLDENLSERKKMIRIEPEI